MIAMDNQPFSITSDQGSIDLLAALEPGIVSLSTSLLQCFLRLMKV